jgi:hypothetical protein
MLETPPDELTGLPLLMVPDERTLPILWGYTASHSTWGQPLADWNHIWHPAREVVEAGEGGFGLRNSRVQFVLRKEQHDEYHAYFAGPALPRRPVERFQAAVLCAAGYIPPKGIQFDSAGPRTVELSPWEIVRLRESGEVKVASFSVVQKFMKDFVLKQSIDHVTPRTADRFLKLDPAASTDDSKQRNYFIHLFLSLSIDRVETAIMAPYIQALEAGLLMPDVPERPDQFILQSIVRSKKNLRAVAAEYTRKLRIHRERRTANYAGSMAMAAS